MPSKVSLQVNCGVTADALFAFYQRNNICEVGFGKETATKILNHPHLIVAAFAGEELIGLARATFDGLSAHIMEFSLDLRYQGDNTSIANGSLMSSDPSGVGHRLGKRLLSELAAMEATFITAYIVADCEEPFYEALGFRANEGHLVYAIDKRPYITPLQG